METQKEAHETIASEKEFAADEKHLDNDSGKIAASIVVEKTVRTMSDRAKVKYTKPIYNPETRKKYYDNGEAHHAAIERAFASGKPVYDPYTNAELVAKQKDAKLRWGAEWQKHAAEADHIDPLDNFVNESLHNPFLTTEDINQIGNDSDNFQVISRKLNQTSKTVGKGGSTQEEWANDKQRMQGVKECIESDESIETVSQRIKEAGNRAEAINNKKAKRAAVKNAIGTAHEAGITGAKQAGVTTLTMSSIMNVVSVIRGEKNAKEAFNDTMADSGKAAVYGYISSGGLTVLSQSLTNTSSEFITNLINSNVPAKVISAIVITGNTLKSWNDGEITTQECLIELGDKGLNAATMGYSMAIGQTLIPIPIVGGAIGALVGSMLTSTYYRKLIDDLQAKKNEQQEKNRIIQECNIACAQMRKYHEELIECINRYFFENNSCFNSALAELDLAFSVGDANAIITNANTITEKLGGEVKYNSIEEFKEFINSDEIDIF